MLYFIPAWYKQNMWCENEQQWYMRRLKSEFDETIKQITLFHRNVDRPYRILVLGYSPNFRHFLHRQGMYRSKYWSCFDAIAQVRRKKVAVLSYHDIKWPKGLEFVYSPFSIIALQGDVKYAQVEFDIYGKGGDEAKLKGLIGRLGCGDYVHLMGQQKLDDVYKHYDAYVAASQSEGFGLTLMEAIGSGLPIVGFDVRYGNQTFIDDGQNGYKIPITDEMDQKEKIKLLSERIVRMFTEDDMDAFSGHSYEKAKEYLTKEVVHRWIELLK